MKNKNEPASSPQQECKVFKNPRDILVYVLLLVLFLLSFLILWEQYRTKPHIPPVQFAQPAAVAVQAAPQNGGTTLPQQLIALQLLEGVLEGWVPLDVLKTYLQKHPSPEAQNMLLELSHVSHCPTFEQLLSSLSPHMAKSKNLWERLKRKVKLLIHIEKTGQAASSKPGTLRGIEVALKASNLSEALATFEILPPEEKEALSAWKAEADKRQRLETLRQAVLLQLAQGQEG